MPTLNPAPTLNPRPAAQTWLSVWWLVRSEIEIWLVDFRTITFLRFLSVNKYLRSWARLSPNDDELAVLETDYLIDFTILA